MAKPDYLNEIELAGRVVKPPQFSHETHGNTFYTLDIRVPRRSDDSDILQVMVDAWRLGDIADSLEEGTPLYIEGSIRTLSYYSQEERRNKLRVLVLARTLHVEQERMTEEYVDEGINQVHLIGFICSEPVYRVTPFGREITDLKLAISRLHDKTDYIPCIAWFKNARLAGDLPVGSHVEVFGRLQSRVYQKRIGNAPPVDMTAYEVSISEQYIL